MEPKNELNNNMEMMEYDYTEGIERDRVVSDPIGALSQCVCSICNKVFFSPVKCPKCENHFYKKCITGLLENVQVECPFSCQFEERASSD